MLLASIPHYILLNTKPRNSHTLNPKPRNSKKYPQPESDGMVSTLESVFEGLLIRFLIFHPVSDDERMIITGAHPGLGDWKPVDNPR
jgi:hypothetical protein